MKTFYCAGNKIIAYDDHCILICGCIYRRITRKEAAAAIKHARNSGKVQMNTTVAGATGESLDLGVIDDQYNE
jgi:predicted DCC family thiol-disulfide oxidoreductase YuxK